jgi:hypothetical protein
MNTWEKLGALIFTIIIIVWSYAIFIWRFGKI